MQNNLMSQAGQMQSHGIPNDMLSAINQVACIVLGPLIQHLLYPFLRTHRINFRPIARITVGFIFMGLAMGYSAMVQRIIYTTGPCYEHATECNVARLQARNNVHILIQAPVYVFIAIGEIFALVTAVEYANEHAPEDMKAIVQAISLLVAGLGSVCAMALAPIAKDPHLVILYAALAVAMAVTSLLFWWAFHSYDAEPEHRVGTQDQHV
jgi:proton-dependent oligopeptide transporter, POT family